MKAVFLDRDGVINRYPGDKKYVTNVNAFKFLPGVKKAIAQLTKRGYGIFVISNQAGVGRKIYSRSTLAAITEKMLQGIRNAGGDLAGVYYCTHRKEENCSCRKPKTGLIHRVISEFPVDLKEAYFVGDTIRDVLTAKAAGCKSILVFSGKEKLSNKKSWEAAPDFFCRDLSLAAKLILRGK
ncbi:MAG: D-glycero-beta-D-manno-heptose 1,7-bisphosphate 7-phosphatase [Candidatus Omnitrophica bacterium]|nr:D-glycero-beta-D-manno-heptose 1,7-bisphosphate 7-phosphatase [Candidatus Omnitrophota bacterium]MDD5652659.1 D-glycero-beta-D-manno-heptose 1,7-bisphosphate 7-phosphatase [Candidatus Omnitrophota bacterium]